MTCCLGGGTHTATCDEHEDLETGLCHLVAELLVHANIPAKDLTGVQNATSSLEVK
jgi:hypothetical protein